MRWRALIIAAVALCATVVAAQQQQPVFVARRDVVRIDVMVTDGNRSLLGLQAADFTVTDNGVRQQVDYVSFDELPLNVVLLKGCDILGVFWGSFTEREPAANARNVETLFAWAEEGRISALSSRIVPLEGVAGDKVRRLQRFALSQRELGFCLGVEVARDREQIAGIAAHHAG